MTESVATPTKRSPAESERIVRRENSGIAEQDQNLNTESALSLSARKQQSPLAQTNCLSTSSFCEYLSPMETSR